MEALTILEGKLATLIASKKLDLEAIKALKGQVQALAEENQQLKAQIEQLEYSLLEGHQNKENLAEQHELTRELVGQLIKDIDLIVNQENEQ